METKTNVMRLLEKQKINYIPHFYPHGDDIPTDGVTVAEFLGKDPASVYKTLVTRSASKAYYVFVVPVAEHLDLKKAAKAVKEKSIEMIKPKRASSSDRLCARRMQSYRNEKKL